MVLCFYTAGVSLPLQRLIDHLTAGCELDERKKEKESSGTIGAEEVDLPPCVDVPAIRGTFSGAVAGSLQCLPECIISRRLTALKCHISTVMN